MVIQWFGYTCYDVLRSNNQSINQITNRVQLLFMGRFMKLM